MKLSDVAGQNKLVSCAGPLKVKASRVKLQSFCVSSAANGFKARRELTGRHVVNLKNRFRVSTPDLPNLTPAKNVDAYMQYLSEDFSRIQLPLGAKLVKNVGNSYELIIPQLQLLEVRVCPTAQAIIRWQGDSIVMESVGCQLVGSHHVEQLGLNNLFNLNANITFTFKKPNQPSKIVTTDTAIDIEVDIPSPFNLIPKPVLEATGNAALEQMVTILMTAYTKNIAADYKLWIASS